MVLKRPLLKRYGTIPHWIKGSFVQNGPGNFTFGSDVFRHLFDGSALVRKFNIADGNVTYQCKFVKTESFKVYTSESGSVDF